MNKTIYISVLLAAMTLPSAVLACDAAGKNVHVGQVLGADGNQFTIRDAQSDQSINFTVDNKMQSVLPAAGDRVAVQYLKTDKGLVVKSIR